MQRKIVRQPQRPVTINRGNALGARVIEYVPLSGKQGAVVSGAPLTLSSGLYQAGQRLIHLRSTGSGFAASVPLNLSAYGKITLAFWAYVDTYTNADRFFLELTSNSQSTPGGFYIDPDSGAAGRFDVSAFGTVSGYDTYNGARPVGTWNHYIIGIDLATAGGAFSLALNGVDIPSSGTTSTTGAPSNFANSTLYIGGRSSGVFSLSGNMEGLTVFNGLLSGAEKRSLFRDTYQILSSAASRLLFDVPAGGTNTYSYTAAGGFVLSGAASKVRSITKAASGGIQAGGASTITRGRRATPAGGLTFGGSASILRRATRAAAGGIQLAGAATVTFFSNTQSRVVVAAGGVIISGAAAIRRSIRKFALGGVLFSGAATVTRTDRTAPANEYFTTIMRVSTVYVSAGAPSTDISVTGQITSAVYLTTIMRASVVNASGTMSAAPTNLTGNLQ